MRKKTDENNLIVISTGGTIEKSYSKSDGLLKNTTSISKDQIFEKLKLPYTTIHFLNLLNKDSLNFTDEDRALLIKTLIDQLQYNYPIIVLHGTDTMVKSAQLCDKTIKSIKVPIIFTGAMIPIPFKDSDASQNIVEALMAAQILSPGLYITFHNKVFTIPNVQKNHQKSTFEEI